MSARTVWETVKVEGGEILERVKEVIQEGNARRIVIKQKGRLVAEFPLTVGLVGAVLAPVLAAIGALAALLSDCSIEIERIAQKSNHKAITRARRGPRSDSGN